MRLKQIVLMVVCALSVCAPSAQAQTIAAGAEHSVVVTPDGIVWTWGANGSGQLGDSTTAQRADPVPVTGIGGVVEIAAADNHSVAMTGDGHA